MFLLMVHWLKSSCFIEAFVKKILYRLFFSSWLWKVCIWFFRELLIRVISPGSLVIHILISVSLMCRLFYTDYTIFIRELKEAIVRTIVCVLHYFYLASGLKINLNNSHILGVGVPNDQGMLLPIHFGCATMLIHFSYFGLVVLGNISRLVVADSY